MKKVIFALSAIVLAGSAMSMPIKPPNCQSTFICPPAVTVANSARPTTMPPPPNCNGSVICPPAVVMRADLGKKVVRSTV